VFFDVAYQSYLPELVSRDDLVDGNGKLEATRATAQVVGPSLGGFLVQAFTAPYAVLVDAASFVWSAGWVTAIRAREPAPVPPPQRHLGKEIGEGLHFVLGHPILRKIAGCTGTANLFGAANTAVLVVFLVRTVHLSSGGIGLLLSVGAVGGLLGALLSGAFTRWVGQARAIWVAALIAAPTELLEPMTHHDWRLVFAATTLFFASVGAVVYNVAQVSFRQAICPRPLLGRMNATMRFLVWGTMPLGGLLGGLLASAFGLRNALWISAIGAQFAPLWVVFSPLRGMRDVPLGPDANEPATV
jgi:predicted MFS family arabinose efflux permease